MGVRNYPTGECLHEAFEEYVKVSEGNLPSEGVIGSLIGKGFSEGLIRSVCDQNLMYRQMDQINRIIADMHELGIPIREIETDLLRQGFSPTLVSQNIKAAQKWNWKGVLLYLLLLSGFFFILSFGLTVIIKLIAWIANP